MSTSNRWHKILKDTDHPNLSEQQTFWRSVALLRIGKQQDAFVTFEKLGARQFSKIEFKLHAAELYLKNNLQLQGEQILIESYSQIKEQQHSKQWHFIAKRYPNPSQELSRLLSRNSSTSQKQTDHSFHDSLSWERGQKLGANIKNPDYYLAWLDWSLDHDASKEVLKHILKSTLENLPNQGFLCFQIFKKLKSLGFWDLLINKLFPTQHRCHAQPELMWQQWWEECPKQNQNELRQIMSEMLQRHPNLKLEKLLNKFSTDA